MEGHRIYVYLRPDGMWFARSERRWGLDGPLAKTKEEAIGKLLLMEIAERDLDVTIRLERLGQ